MRTTEAPSIPADPLAERLRSAGRALISALQEAAASDLDPRRLTDLLDVAFTLRNQLDAALTAAVGTLDRGLEGDPEGAASLGLSCPAWLGFRLRLSAAAAHVQVHLARRLPAYPATRQAFARGELSAQHAGVVVRVLEAIERGGAVAEEAEPLLLQEAERSDPRSLYRWGLSLLHQLAPRELEDEEERRHRRRHLRLAEVFDGGYELEGYLDPEGGATLETALEGLLGPRPRGDERTPGQRRADGLVELARRVLDSGRLPRRGGQRPHLTLTATLETLRGDPGAPAAWLNWTFPISGTALRRLAREAEVTPILVDGRGDPLRVGRRYRTAPGKLSRALAERDRGCVWPGCDAPPEWSQRHHEHPWAQGGRTEIERMSLLCVRHHRLLSRGWRLERQGRRVVVQSPRRPTPLAGSALPAGPDPPAG